MALFNELDFIKVESDSSVAPDGLVDVSDAAWAYEKFIEWLKGAVATRLDPFEMLGELLPGAEFWGQFPPSDDDSSAAEVQVLIAASSCFIHVAALFEGSSVEEMVRHLSRKFRHSKCIGRDLSEILIDACEVLENDTPVAREKFFMKILNRACEEQEWPTRFASLRFINVLSAMLVAILLDGCDDPSRSIALLELDGILEHARANNVLPYYLQDGEDAQ